MKFSEFINEKYINLFNKDEKLKYIDEIWNILNKTYEKIGGIKGSGFSNKEDMLNINMWKLVRKSGKIIACAMYKDKNGRKAVAFGSDGSKEGKEAIKQIIFDEIYTGRSYSEVSGPLLNFIEKNIKNFYINYAKTFEEAKNLLNKELEKVDDFKYKRKIGNEEIEKVMFGNIGNRIKEK